MRCYYHPEIDAVGICKNCQRGLCSESAAEAGDSLACRGRCEAKVQLINDLIDSTPKRVKDGARATSTVGLALSLVFAVVGISALLRGSMGLGAFMLSAAVIYVGWGVWVRRTGRTSLAPSD